MDQHDRPAPVRFNPQHDPGARLTAGLSLTTPQQDVVGATLGAIRRGISLVVVTGESGCGRSVVMDAVAAALHDQGLHVDRGLSSDGLSPEALLSHAASLLRLDPALLARAVLPPVSIMLTTDFEYATAMVVDDADAWPASALEMLLNLARLRLFSGPLLHVVMAGQAGSLRPTLCAA